MTASWEAYLKDFAVSLTKAVWNSMEPCLWITTAGSHQSDPYPLSFCLARVTRSWRVFVEMEEGTT